MAQFARGPLGPLLSITIAPYWTDGRRSLKEICDLVELETGVRATEHLVRAYSALAKEGIIAM